MKNLRDFIKESLNEAKFNWAPAKKWLKDSKNKQKFVGHYGIGDLDLAELAFGWVAGSLNTFGSIDELIDFLHSDAPDNFPEYAEDEFDDFDQIEDADWTEFFDDMGKEIAKLF